MKFFPIPRLHLNLLLHALFAFTIALLTGCRSGGEQKGELGRTYQNPVYAGNMPDPSVRRFGEFYYAFGTTGKERLPDGRIFTLLRSRNLVDWELLGGALVPPSGNRNYEYWAPEITEDDGKYYLYYSMGGIEPERFVLRVAVSARPEGPYLD